MEYIQRFTIKLFDSPENMVKFMSDNMLGEKDILAHQLHDKIIYALFKNIEEKQKDSNKYEKSTKY